MTTNANTRTQIWIPGQQVMYLLPTSTHLALVHPIEAEVIRTEPDGQILIEYCAPRGGQRMRARVSPLLLRARRSA